MQNKHPSLEQELVVEIEKSIQQELSLRNRPQLSFEIIYDDDRRIYKITLRDLAVFFILKVRGLKVVKQLDLDSNDLQKEYDLLQGAWQYAQSMENGYSMSKPISLWLEHKAMLMSGCSGENFNDIFNKNLFKWSYNADQLNETIYRCGIWLGSYHKLSSTTKSLIGEFDNRQTNLDRMLQFLKNNQKHSVTLERLQLISRQFKHLTSQEPEGPVCQVHGNFAYRNILCNLQQVNLVDFEDAHHEYVAFDIGQFIAEIMLKSQFPWLRHRYKRLVESFVEGYEKNLQLQQPIVDAYIGYHLVTHLYEHCSRRKSSGLAAVLLRYRISYLSKILVRFSKSIAD